MHIVKLLPLALAALLALPAQAQEAPAAVAASAASSCELHVFPTENYIGLNTGLLSGMGLLGAVADVEAHKNRVATVKDLMAGYLGPDIQVEELKRVGFVKALGLNDSYRVIIEPATPSGDDAKAHPEIKAMAKAFNEKLKTGKRVTASTNPCYAELLLFSIFYHKAMMYGSNLFVGTMFRDFTGREAPLVSSGAVKNPLEDFPPKTPDKVDAAKAELREAFSKDFLEWVNKKLAKPGAVPAK
ncbi:hypothetical protein [Novosphingobium sp. SG720]|uniref:hypothetical protein n=1 Tax=Novosphingobium sp. SG720 TaxID=2586998 RepID=UPI001444D729|nr:hypothetical protein [Novosphingobium sp. SG720]NKJ44928.1 hypothetical protein [Novosphingobium sp. SG720]